jgi:alanine racemase
MVSASVDTGALRHNLQIVRQWAPKSRVMAVIKANAYGHGLVNVARALESTDAFAVARVDEGLTLRAAGIETPTLLLEGVFDRDQLEAAAAARFELAVHTQEQIELLRAAAPGVTFKVWLKFDSGMNRLGFKGAAFGAAHAALSSLSAVQSPVNLFTHLASADEPELSTTSEQLARFAAATSSFPGERSIANSAGMLSFSEAQADWVRPGLLLYGVSPNEGAIGADYGLRPVMTLHSHVIAVKDLAVGEQVGYGGSGLWRRLPTESGLGCSGLGQRRTYRSGGPGVDGHDRNRCHRPQAAAQAGRSCRALGRRVAGGGNRRLGGDHTL